MSTTPYINQQKIFETLAAKLGDKEANRLIEEAKQIRYATGMKTMNTDPLTKEELKMVKDAVAMNKWKDMIDALNLTEVKNGKYKTTITFAHLAIRMLKNNQKF